MLNARVSVDLGRLTPLGLSHAVSVATMAVGAEVQRHAKSYPRRRHDIRQRWKTARQRRWWFWALRTGRVQYPYRRTGRLMHGWKLKRYGSQDAVVENAVPYAQWVQGDSTQSYYHRRVPWPTDRRIAETVERDPRTERIVSQIILHELGG